MSSASTSSFAIASPTVADRSTQPFTQLDLSDTDRSRLQNFVHSGHESSPVPDGHDHWTLRLLAGKAVELGFVEHISPETIRALLKKTSSSPGGTSSGVSQR